MGFGAVIVLDTRVPTWWVDGHGNAIYEGAVAAIAVRFIVATARKLGAPVVSADEKIRAYRHVRTIW